MTRLTSTCPRPIQLVTLFLSAILCLAAGACAAKEESHPSLLMTSVQSVSVSGVAPTVGITSQLKATASLSDGTTQDVTSLATWFSSNTGVITVSTNGVATGVGGGTAVVQATFQGVTGVLSLNVIIALPSPPSIFDVFTCTPTSVDASNLARTLFVPSYPSGSLSEVDLGYTSKDAPGAYAVQLTVIVNGSPAGTQTVGITVGAAGQRAAATFSFSPSLRIVPGSSVRLVSQRSSGPGELSYEGTTDAGCPVLVTADSTSTTQIVGPKIPIRVIGTP